MIQFPLYIDPGTGSMLFSILIGAATTLFFLFKALWIKLKVLIWRNKDTTTDSGHKSIVFYNEGKQYGTLFEPICDEFERRNVNVTYYTSYEEDFAFNKNYSFIHPEFIGTGNKAYARLNMLDADVVLMTTPGIQVYQLKRSRHVKHYSHILHAPSDATMYRLFGLDYFDSILLTGDYQKQDIRILEKKRGLPEKDLVTVGCPYLDKLIQTLPQQNDKDHIFTVLVSPSWGKSALLSKYGEKLLDPLVNTGWKIIIRPHPQSKKSEASVLERLTEKYKDRANVSWDYNPINTFAMSESDIMLSDFSGIIFDYSFLYGKPFIFLSSEMDLRPYDAYDIDEGKNIWQFSTVRKMGYELNENQLPDIKNVINKVVTSSSLSEEREKAKSEAWMYQGESAVRVADYLLSIVG